jgi:hypothetical protein
MAETKQKIKEVTLIGMGKLIETIYNPKAVIVDPVAQLLIIEATAVKRSFIPLRNLQSWQIVTEAESGLVL